MRAYMQAMTRALVLLCAIVGCNRPQLRSDHESANQQSPKAATYVVDRSIDPCVDFYAYACGPWLHEHPIPATYSRWSRFAALEDEDVARELAVVKAAVERPATPVERRVGAYYAACMDLPAIDARGLEPLAELLRRADVLASRSASAAAIAEALAFVHARGVRGLFELEVVPDPRDVRRTIAALDVGSLGMGSPEAYTRDDSEARDHRDRYREHVTRVLAMLGGDAAGDAERIIALETQLARALPSAAERRNDADQVHALALDELTRTAPAIAWSDYFRELGAGHVDRVDVLFLPYLRAVDAVLTSDRPAVRAYTRYQIARQFATVLPSALDSELFDFRGRISSGAREQTPRGQRCLDLLDRDLRDDVGRLFVAAYFPSSARARAAAIVAEIVEAFTRELRANTWLGGPARGAALAKLANMRFLIGTPARWRSYDDVDVRRDDPVGNAERAAAAATRFELAKLGKPTDRDEMFEPAQSEAGYGVKSEVSVGFSAGFLQPPVLDAHADDAVTLGGMGAVIGHEITHHFDDVGRKYDVDGNIAPWWSAEDSAHYEQRAACFVAEYEHFHIADGTPVDGRLTLGENLADNGGLRIAWDALGPGQRGASIEGFTPAQRFFLGWARLRCENVTPEAARAQVHSDPHAPGEARVNGVVRNMPAFASAFGCRAGTPMAPTERCSLW
jgi:putative endopeptidase